ncbi:uncharacterized protein ttc6 [Triplophysa rosa]|uniref:uncharacterized protein ttc6 n=1 Tax=Triplophysa rosa TaxID=992332 RepID=UPI0025461486|nr:uncharacterized protein ttc6 [Triplophysa rosa]
MPLRKPKPGHDIVQKPVIASLAGTTKAVSMSHRPQPPIKPRSEKNLSAGGSYKPSTLTQQGACASKKAHQSAFCSPGSSENFEDGEQNGFGGGTTESFWEAGTHQALSKSHTSSSCSSRTQSVKSTSELLMEARLIAGLEQPDESGQQRATEETLPDTTVKESGHTGDEIIGTLQREVRIETLPTCKQMAKKCMESESGHRRTEYEGPTRRDSSVPQLNVYISEERCSRPVCPQPVSSGDKTAVSVDCQVGCDDKELKDVFSPVTNEDIIMARGHSLTQRAERTPHQTKTIQRLSLVATWKPKKDYRSAKSYKTIHHFCTTPVSQIVPVELQLASRFCHTQNLITATPQLDQQMAAPGQLSHPDLKRLVCEGVAAESAGVSGHTDCISHIPKQPSDTLADWQRIAEFYVERPRIIMCGRAATLCASELRMFWNPAPPKFICAPCVLKEKLFPEYQITRPDQYKENMMDHVVGSVSHETVAKQKNVSSSQCKSLPEVKTMEMASFTSFWFGANEQARRPRSAPHLTPDPEPLLQLRSDFTSLSQELEHVRLQQQKSVCAAQAGEFLSNARQAELRDVHAGPSSSEGPCQAPNHRRNPCKCTDRTSVPCYKRNAAKRGKKLSSVKMAYVCKTLSEPPRTLKRSESLCQLPWKPKPSEGPSTPFNRLSLPLLLDFESFAVDRGGIPDTAPPREWVRDLWDAWFDELFPPLEKIQSTDSASGGLKENKPPQALDRVDLCEVLEEGLTIADLEREVAKLTQVMTERGTRSAFDLCRRGALQIKLGYLNQALEDLNAAISLEPHLLDAYWHRHNVYLLRNDPSRALADLDIIIRNNKMHADAFMSRAEIFKERGETTAAIISYTQAIKANPDKADIYFRRAQVYEKTSEILLAMEDYATTFAVDSTRTDAMMICGVQHFNNSQWTLALDDFSLLLQQEPRNAVARTYRGRIYTKLGRFEEAIEDLSLAVHLNPSDWLAFYHRGFLLRKIKPQMALRDLSTSVLINDSTENLRSFLHRGLLYAQLRLWRQATADFEAVIKLDRSVAVAYVSLGLISMLKMNRNHEAIKRFSDALKADPSCVRACVCRAKAYYNVNNLSPAVKDLSRAIHVNPDAHDLHIMRGQYLYEMGRFDLAHLSIRYAAEMKTALGLSAVQQAIAQSFLGNEAEAIACLQDAVDTRPSLPALVLLGKTLMREHRFTEAVETFGKALEMLDTNKAKRSSVEKAAEVFHLIGVCCVAQVPLLQESEDSLLLQALDAFNSAVSMKPDLAEAYHQRGLCRTYLRDSASGQDFNTALRINPNLYQVHLSRAALYGAEGRYAKAVLDCNEAIRIQPKSVRAYLYKGALQFYLKAYKKAVEDLSVAIQMDPACAFAYYNRGVCYQKLQDYELALRDYSVVLLLDGEAELDLKVLINRGLLYVELNDYSSALQDFTAAAHKRPDDAIIHHTLGVIHHRLGQLEEALDSHGMKHAQRDFLTALHLNPLCSNARIGLAYNLQVLGFFLRAWNQFTVAMEVNLKCWQAYEGRAVVSLQMGNPFAALQDINTAIEYNPHSELLLTNRGLIQQLMGDKVSAMKDYQKAISLNPKYALAHFNAATLFFYNGQFEQACEFYSRAFELDPSDESAILNRAITHALLRKIPEALQDFNETLRLNPLTAHVYFNRANLSCSLRQHQSAEEDLTQALWLQPGDALLYKLRADVRARLGWTEQALKDYRTAVELEDSEA